MLAVALLLLPFAALYLPPPAQSPTSSAQVLEDDARLPEAERKSRAAARITGAVAANTAALGSGIAVLAAGEVGVGVLAGGGAGAGAVAGGIAVAAAAPLAAAMVLGFGAYGVRRVLDKRRVEKRARFIQHLVSRRLLVSTAGATDTLRAVLNAFLSWGAFPSSGFGAFRKSLRERVLTAATPLVAEPKLLQARAAEVARRTIRGYTRLSDDSVAASIDAATESFRLSLEAASAPSTQASPSAQASPEPSPGGGAEPSPSSCGVIGPADELAGGLADLPKPEGALWERRLSKKAGDLVHLYSVWLDWEHTTSQVGAHPLQSGGLSDFREDLRDALCAYSGGISFERASGRPPQAEKLLHELRVLVAALYTFLLWRSDSAGYGYHDGASRLPFGYTGRSYETFAGLLQEALSEAWPDVDPPGQTSSVMLRTFEQMRAEATGSEELLRAVTGCQPGPEGAAQEVEVEILV